MRVFVIAALIILLTSVAAQADTLNYTGETSSITGWGGPNHSDTLWDYVYDISDWHFNANPRWAILCPVQPLFIEASAWGVGGGWTGTWYASIPGSAHVNDANVVGQAGVLWTVTDGNNEFANANYFHFTAATPPVKQPYDGDSWNGPTTLTEYSDSAAAPEPCSIALMGILMAGGGLWRRRRNRK